MQTLSTTTADLRDDDRQAAPLSQTAPVLLDEERQRCEVWTRVMGYHRPVSAFNIGKQGEFNERLHFQEQRAER